jgi:hypothetical protein
MKIIDREKKYKALIVTVANLADCKNNEIG